MSSSHSSHSLITQRDLQLDAQPIQSTVPILRWCCSIVLRARAPILNTIILKTGIAIKIAQLFAASGGCHRCTVRWTRFWPIWAILENIRATCLDWCASRWFCIRPCTSHTFSAQKIWSTGKLINCFACSKCVLIDKFLIRCKIPECENGTDLAYNPSWLANAVPYESTTPAKCARYAPYDNQTTNNCSSTDFNHQQTLSCNSYVYSTEEITILQDVSIQSTKTINTWFFVLIARLTITRIKNRAHDTQTNFTIANKLTALFNLSVSSILFVLCHTTVHLYGCLRTFLE